MGIDYEGMMAALHGGAEPLSGVVPPGLWGHVDDLYPTYDVAKATDLLTQAGYGPNGEPMDLELTYVTGDSDEQTVATLMKSNLADLNVKSMPVVCSGRRSGRRGSRRSRGSAPRHLPLLLVAGLRRSLLVVHQPVPHRGPSLLQPVVLLEPGDRHDHERRPGAIGL